MSCRSQQLADKRAQHAAEKLEVSSGLVLIRLRSLEHCCAVSPLQLCFGFCAPTLQLERHMQQLVEQRQHVAAQLEQLEGCEGGQEQLGVSDLRKQLEVSFASTSCVWLI